MSMDPQVGNLVRGDVLIEGKRILAIGPNLFSGNVDVIDARGRIVMPGFIDTHHHQAWTAIRSSIPDSILIDDGTGTPSAQQNYFGNVLSTFAPVVPAAGCLHQRIGRRPLAARQRRDDRARHFADPSLAAALRRRREGADRRRPTRRARLFRKCRQRCRQPVSDRRVPHQTALVLLERPAHLHDHGRRSLPRRSRPTPRHGRSGASSDSRSRLTSFRRSACARSWTTSPPAPAAPATTSGSDPTTCSST